MMNDGAAGPVPWGAWVLFFFLLSSPAHPGRDVGLIEKKDAEAFEGYTLFAPLFSETTYLIDMEGRVVNSWKSGFEPGQSAYLLENGHLLRTAAVGPRNRVFHGGGAGGRVQEFTWNGDLVWDFAYSSPGHLQHHDIERLPNGHVLMIAWERKTREEAVAAGRNPETLGPGGLWPDHLIEVEPTGKTMGKIVWEWHVWDHLVQEIDPDKANYGVVADHPELIDINHGAWTVRLEDEEREKLAALGYLGSSKRQRSRGTHPDFNHTNSISYDAALDRIALSVLSFNEVWIIDHGTTTGEAAGHEGGPYGKGGDLLYRFGNPEACHRGTARDRILFAQHDAEWIRPGLPGAGHILLFNNGRGRPGGGFSSVDEFVLPVDGKGRYAGGEGKVFAPPKLVWSFEASPGSDFNSGHISGAQRLPNGNTLVCSGEKGVIFEVTPEKEVVWKYVNPVAGRPGGRGPGGPPPGGFGPRGSGSGRAEPESKGPPGGGSGGFGQGGGRPAGGGSGWGRWGGRRPGPGPGGPGGRGKGPQNCVFRAYRYGPGFPGLAGRDLDPVKTVEELISKKPAAPGHPNGARKGDGGRSSRGAP